MINNAFRIISRGRLGDALLSTPSLKAIKEANPERKIEVYCKTKRLMEIYTNNPYVDRLKPATFYSNPIRYTLYFFKALKVNKIPYSDSVHILSLNYKKHATEIIAEMLDVELIDKNVQVFLTKDEEDNAKKLLSEYQNPVSIHITSSCTKNQNWPLEYWEELVREIPEYTFIQLGLADEDRVSGAIDLRGKMPFRETLAVLKHSKSFVGVASSLSHATNAFDIPGVVLFGASLPEVWGHANNINLYRRLSCAPCIDVLGSSPCPYGRPCMTEITVSEVKAALISQMSKQVYASPLLPLPIF
jgi:ADP-heptose:LPS heptosyltransferase